MIHFLRPRADPRGVLGPQPVAGCAEPSGEPYKTWTDPAAPTLPTYSSGVPTKRSSSAEFPKSAAAEGGAKSFIVGRYAEDARMSWLHTWLPVVLSPDADP
jgi:hypothetical protein